jgi:hypothetical protein
LVKFDVPERGSIIFTDRENDLMNRPIILVFAMLFSTSAVLAQRSSPPLKTELAEITERGRRLAEYDVAAWYGTDAVVAMKPAEGSVARYIAKKTDEGWVVAFGRFNEQRDRFLIVYEATEGASPKEFRVKKYDPPKEDTEFYLSAAKAIEAALGDFKGESRPYNVAVLQAKLNQVYVYVIPAQTETGVYPLGGDTRYLISQDGSKIVEKRRLHVSILEVRTPASDGNLQGGFHTAVLDDIPEDTDVFNVLSRKPSVPEWVATKRYVYRIEADGTINYVMKAEAFMKSKGK